MWTDSIARVGEASNSVFPLGRGTLADEYFLMAPGEISSTTLFPQTLLLETTLQCQLGEATLKFE